ncbi:MAG: pectate lyase [Treponema sp.]|nr:pectate lyase [Treponema sp.]
MKKTLIILISLFVIMGCATKPVSKQNENGIVRFRDAKPEILASLQVPPSLSPLQVPYPEDLQRHFQPVTLSMFGDGISHARFGTEGGSLGYDIYAETQIAGIAENILFAQNNDGGWGKNIDYAKMISEKNMADPIYRGGYRLESTLDNNNIYTQIQYLSLVYKIIPDPRYAQSMIRAFDWIVKNQNKDSGGFRGADVDAVTFNDNVMIGVLNICSAIFTDTDRYSFFTDEQRVQAKDVYDKALACILKCQVKVPQADGTMLLTAWGQQHDHKTFEPVWARNYEPPSITASESVGVIRALMSIENPSDEIKTSIIAACEWLNRDDIKIWGYDLVRVPIERQKIGARYYDFDQRLVENKDAEPLWARFYDPVTMKPLWYDRGKKLCAEYNDISLERRNGYRYVYTWPKNLLKTEYPEWKAKNNIK